MSRTAWLRWPISSPRWLKSGISSRLLHAVADAVGGVGKAAQRTRDGRGQQDGEEHGDDGGDAEDAHDGELRSAWTMASMSPASVDSSSTPSTVPKRWIGTATETISSPRSRDAHDGCRAAGQRVHDFGIAHRRCRRAGSL